jgi:hypothetical protein
VREGCVVLSNDQADDRVGLPPFARPANEPNAALSDSPVFITVVRIYPSTDAGKTAACGLAR